MQYLKILCIKQVNRIKKFDYPECRKCKHFLPDKTFDNENSQLTFGRCSYFGIKDLVTGEIKYNYASVCRLPYAGECGQYGKYYSEKKE